MRGNNIKNLAFLYLCFFLFYWLFINRNVIMDIYTSQDLLNILSSYAGYNSIMLHGTIYSYLYLLLLLHSYPKNLIQLLTRIHRRDLIKRLFHKMIIVALVFVGMFTFVNTLLVSLNVDFTLLITNRFYLGVLISFFSLLLLYMTIGTLFLMLSLLLSEVKAFIIVAISCTLLVCTYLLLGWWTPFADIVIYDSLLTTSGLDLLQVAVNYIKNGAVILLLFYGTNITFEMKDVLNE